MMTDLEKIEARMANGEPFSFHQLWVPLCGGDSNHPAYRLADRTIQRWRRKGWIAFVRIGRDTVWSLTDAGHAEHKD